LGGIVRVSQKKLGKKLLYKNLLTKKWPKIPFDKIVDKISQQFVNKTPCWQKLTKN
jgi:hypothetical protein